MLPDMSRRSFSLLHACGDVSLFVYAVYDTELFAPRMWRCFYLSFE